MLVHAYMKKRVVYVPTVVHLTTGAYVDIDPVAVEPVTNADGLRRAFLETLARGNAVVPPPPKGEWPRPILLKYSGAKSWSAFARGAAMWSMEEESGHYQIIGYRDHPDGYWARDPDQTINFAAGTAINTVIDRMISILQQAARR